MEYYSCHCTYYNNFSSFPQTRSRRGWYIHCYPFSFVTILQRMLSTTVHTQSSLFSPSFLALLEFTKGVERQFGAGGGGDGRSRGFLQRDEGAGLRIWYKLSLFSSRFDGLRIWHRSLSVFLLLAFVIAGVKFQSEVDQLEEWVDLGEVSAHSIK